MSGLTGHRLNDVSLTVAEGEIVGVAGLPDSGRDALVAALFGAIRASGHIELDGQPVRIHSPRDAIKHGIGFVPAERRSQAIFPAMSIADNSVVLDLPQVTTFGFVRRSRLRELASARLAEFDVRGNVRSDITGLSGGNQQKVVLSRWLAHRPRLLLLDDPTRGVDVGAKAEIHERIVAAADGGAAVVMASSDLPELLYTCDRIIVMADGRVAGSLDRSEATEESVMALATGTADLPHPELRGTPL